MYNIVLLEKEGTQALSKWEVLSLLELLKDTGVYPVELEAYESSAIGFITSEAAEKLDYDYESSGLHNFIARILDDMELENKDGIYHFQNLSIYLSREVHKNNAADTFNGIYVSTAHISPQTADLLKNDGIEDIVVYQKLAGWFICVSNWDDDLEHKFIPEDLQRCLAYAQKNNAEWMILDSEQPIVSNLPVYDY